MKPELQPRLDLRPKSMALSTGQRRRFGHALVLVACTLMLARPTVAAELEGVFFPDRQTIRGVELTLMGTGLLKYRIFIKAYVAAFYAAGRGVAVDGLHVPHALLGGAVELLEQEVDGLGQARLADLVGPGDHRHAGGRQREQEYPLDLLGIHHATYARRSPIRYVAPAGPALAACVVPAGSCRRSPAVSV